MQFKKNRAILAAVLAAAMASSALLSVSASAFEKRTKPEKFGDKTYAQRFMSLYDDVYTNGKESERTYMQDGTYEEKVLSNEASGTLVMKDDGKIYWTRDGADQFPTAFEKYEYTEPDYEGNWVDTVSKRAQMKIKKSGDGYIVRIEWGGGVSTRAMWDIPMVVYNQTKDALVYDNCTEFERNYKSDGTYQDTVFTTKGTGTLTLKSDGKIYWHRNSAPDEDLIFERSSEEFNPFEDVTKEDYFYDAVLWAYKNGITQGMSDTEFMPALNVTRGQVVTFLWRVAGKPAPTKSTNPFADVTPPFISVIFILCSSIY